MNRSIVILPAFILVALLLTVLYAVLGFRGPVAVLRDAREALDRNQLERSIKLLNTAEAAIGDKSASLLENTLRMRVVAYVGLGLKEKALQDIRVLFDRLRVGDQDLMTTQIRTLNELAVERDDRTLTAEAWKLADDWLARHSGDAVILAEAGATKDLMAQQEIGDWADSIRKVTVPGSVQALRSLMEAAVFSSAGSRIHGTQLMTLVQAVEQVIPGSRQGTTDTVTRIRDLALQARDLYLRSLSPGTMVLRAYQGLAAQLRIAGDDDTLIMLAQSYLNGTRTADRLAAAVDIAEAHLRHGRLHALVRGAEQVLPVGSLGSRLQADSLDRYAVRLIACRALALHRLGDQAQKDRLVTDFLALVNQVDPARAESLGLHPLQNFVIGLLTQEPGQQRGHLVHFVHAVDQQESPWNRRLLLTEAYRKLELVCADAEKEAMLQQWMRAIPDSVEPVHALARFRMGRGAADQAVPELERALQSLPDPDATLALLVEAQKALFRGDLDAVIAQAAELGVQVPDELGPYPALALAAARRALQLGKLDIALACCQRTRERYGNTRSPLRLEARILLALDRRQLARPLLQRLVERDPRDQESLDMLLQIDGSDAEPDEELRFQSLVRGTPSLASTRFLGRKWLSRRHYSRVLMLARQAAGQFGADLELQVLALRAMLLDPQTPPADSERMLRAVYLWSQTAGDSPRVRRLRTWTLGQYVLKNPEKAPEHVRSELLAKFLADNRHPEDLTELVGQLVEAKERQLALQAATELVSGDRYAATRTGDHFVTAGRLALALGNRPEARALLKGALGFRDGHEAELDIAIIDRLDGKTPEFTRPPALDSVAACCLTPDREAAIASLTRQLAGNPENLAAQCALAVLRPNDALSPRVRALAKAAGEQLLIVVAMVELEAFAGAAIRELEALRKLEALHELEAEAGGHPGAAVLAVLVAKAHANAGDAAAVRATLDRAREALVADPVLAATALDVLTRSDRSVLGSSAIMNNLLTAALAQGSPTLMATLIRNNAAWLDVPGVRESTLALVAKFWIDHPKLAGAGLREVRILLEAGDPVTALRLLQKLEPLQPPERRGEFLELYFSTMQTVAKRSTPAITTVMAQAAIKVLQTECVHGAPLHFVMDVLDREIARLAGTEAGDDARRRMLDLESQYLQKHIEYFLSGKDGNVANLTRTLSRYGQREGLGPALQKVDEVLRADPSLVRIWMLRAEWLVQLGRESEAVTSLSWLPQYLQDPAVADALIQLMGRAGILVEKGSGLLKQESLVAASKLSLGIVQLRLGNHIGAAQALELAQPHPNGDHLYYRAMALLTVGLPETTNDARRLLLQLVEQYPDSSHAESARTVCRMYSSELGR